jgi:hypothetical protein
MIKDIIIPFPTAQKAAPSTAGYAKVAGLQKSEDFMTGTYEQQPFDPGPFVDNPSQRCPCLLLLDVSASMTGRPIKELNAGLVLLKDELSADPLASKRVQVGVVTFGPVETATDFVDARHWDAPVLTPKGNTPMGAAIEHGLQMLEAQKTGSSRKKVGKSQGIMSI